MKVLFFGSSTYCLPVLEILYKEFSLVEVVTKFNSKVHRYCLNNKIQVFTPSDNKELLDLKPKLQKLSPHISIVSDYGLIIPKEIFEIPKYKTLNIHFSKLPKFRGPSPVQYTILYGEKSAWITIIIMDESMDTGDIIWSREAKSGSARQMSIETTGSLYKKLFEITAEELPNIITLYTKGQLTPQKQDHSKATYTKHLRREDGFIPWKIILQAMTSTPGVEHGKRLLKEWPLTKLLSDNLTTQQFSPEELLPRASGLQSHALEERVSGAGNLAIIIERALRAFTPWPGLWTNINLSLITNAGDRPHLLLSNGKDSNLIENLSQKEWIKKRLKILKAHLGPIQGHLQGQPLQMASVRLILDLVQLEGKKPVTWRQLLEGYPDLSLD